MKRVTDCERLWDALCSYAEDPAGAELALVESHLRSCADCARDLVVLRHISETVAMSDLPIPPHSLRSRILAVTVERPCVMSRLAEAFGALRPPSIPRLALGAAASAAALYVLMGFPRHNAVVLIPATSAQSPRVGIAKLPSALNSQKTPVRADSIKKENTDSVPASGSVDGLNTPEKHDSGSVSAASFAITHPRVLAATESAQSPVVLPNPADIRRVELPEPERATPQPKESEPEPRIERERVEPPIEPDPVLEPSRIARAEDRPAPIPETKSMSAAPGASQSSYTLEAKSSIDPGTVASLASLRRSLQKESEDEQTSSAFRLDDRREVRLSVHTSRF